jgi:hypothetical protein
VVGNVEEEDRNKISNMFSIHIRRFHVECFVIMLNKFSSINTFGVVPISMEIRDYHLEDAYEKCF